MDLFCVKGGKGHNVIRDGAIFEVDEDVYIPFYQIEGVTLSTADDDEPELDGRVLIATSNQSAWLLTHTDLEDVISFLHDPSEPIVVFE